VLEGDIQEIDSWRDKGESGKKEKVGNKWWVGMGLEGL
jgi:hypothetical protein